jgi:predicted transcriptional regulator YdeE
MVEGRGVLNMNLNENTELVNWPETHYIYIEKKGPFQTTAPQAWRELQKAMPELAQKNSITGSMSLYKMGPPEMIYRAGVSVAEAPKEIPTGMQYMKFKGGTYTCFVLKGSYSQLPEASGRVHKTVSEKQIALRDDFYIENYVNNPQTTPENDLLTEILIPTQPAKVSK